MGHDILRSQIQFIILKQIQANIDKEYDYDGIQKAVESIHEGKINFLQNKKVKKTNPSLKKRIPKW
jgi:hypothetical protein